MEDIKKDTYSVTIYKGYEDKENLIISKEDLEFVMAYTK